MRSLTLSDYIQTEEWVKRTPGIYEMNPNLRGPSLDTAIKMFGWAEGTIFLIRQLPAPIRPLVGSLVIALRLPTVTGNAKLGARTPVYIPLFSARF